MTCTTARCRHGEPLLVCQRSTLTWALFQRGAILCRIHQRIHRHRIHGRRIRRRGIFYTVGPGDHIGQIRSLRRHRNHHRHRNHRRHQRQIRLRHSHRRSIRDQRFYLSSNRALLRSRWHWLESCNHRCSNLPKDKQLAVM